jgi:hypothetical protein
MQLQDILKRQFIAQVKAYHEAADKLRQRW